ncbi:hypothetical protein HDU76_001419 [Blyttiomyces sp. JEL0837]|nr:hypothetical protein HDU76_001419 [Blyttiomyces sp. JEL0837]
MVKSYNSSISGPSILQAPPLVVVTSPSLHDLSLTFNDTPQPLSLSLRVSQSRARTALNPLSPKTNALQNKNVIDGKDTTSVLCSSIPVTNLGKAYSELDVGSDVLDEYMGKDGFIPLSKLNMLDSFAGEKDGRDYVSEGTYRINSKGSGLQVVTTFGKCGKVIMIKAKSLVLSENTINNSHNQITKPITLKDLQHLQASPSSSKGHIVTNVKGYKPLNLDGMHGTLVSLTRRLTDVQESEDSENHNIDFTGQQYSSTTQREPHTRHHSKTHDDKKLQSSWWTRLQMVSREVLGRNMNCNQKWCRFDCEKCDQLVSEVENLGEDAITSDVVEKGRLVMGVRRRATVS